jgi:hypothetical protein
MVEIRLATRDEINGFVPRIYAHLVDEAYGAFEGGARCVGMAGFAVDPDDPLTGSFLASDLARRWAFMDVKPEAKAAGYRILRAISRRLHEVNRTVRVQCGDSPKAERLLRAMSFEPTSETKNGARVWVWQSWPQ